MGWPNIDLVIILTVTDDPTQWVAFEVKLYVHVLPLYREKK